MGVEAEGLPYFFLTYAHTQERAWVARFYKDLCTDIWEKTTWPTAEAPGFMDDDGIRGGEDWRRSVAVALATCRVLVPLYSRRYFTREQCGYEWYAFINRMREHKARYGTDVSAIVPVLWTPLPQDRIPDAAHDIHLDFGSVHNHYAQHGLYTLIKNQAYRSTYRRVVTHVADRIIQAAENEPLAECSADDITLDQDAFRQAQQPLPAGRRLTLLIAAPAVGRLPAERAADAYGPEPLSWNPFHNEMTVPLTVAAGRIASLTDYRTESIPVQSGLERDWTRTEAGVGVLLIDPWLVMDSQQIPLLRRLNDVQLDRLRTLLIWNMHDRQTRDRAEEIRKLLQQNAPRLLEGAGSRLGLGGRRINSFPDFTSALTQELDRLTNTFLNTAEAQPPAGSSGMPPRLMLPDAGAFRDDPRPEGVTDGH